MAGSLIQQAMQMATPPQQSQQGKEVAASLIQQAMQTASPPQQPEVEQGTEVAASLIQQAMQTATPPQQPQQGKEVAASLIQQAMQTAPPPQQGKEVATSLIQQAMQMATPPQQPEVEQGIISWLGLKFSTKLLGHPNPEINASRSGGTDYLTTFSTQFCSGPKSLHISTLCRAYYQTITKVIRF